ncbi:uncharacterized protein METZ01_LOCUS282573 [marine metagenome]|jgi:hypothetical protein|uniref:Uncharacterized protein n=1 Tax=marine metagenome TaxID=408172 RepID=A0A382KZG5_9ZZZZ
MVNQKGIWAATGDMTIPKCRSAIPPGQAPGLTAGRLFSVIDDSQKLAYLQGRTSSVPSDENQANYFKAKSRERIHINRVAGGNCNYSHPSRATFAGPGQS